MEQKSTSAGEYLHSGPNQIIETVVKIQDELEHNFWLSDKIMVSITTKPVVKMTINFAEGKFRTPLENALQPGREHTVTDVLAFIQKQSTTILSTHLSGLRSLLDSMISAKFDQDGKPTRGDDGKTIIDATQLVTIALFSKGGVASSATAGTLPQYPPESSLKPQGPNAGKPPEYDHGIIN